MLRLRLAGAGIGLVFGFTLVWSGMISPDVIRAALLFEDAYLFLFFASALLTGAGGLWLLRRSGTRALLTGEAIRWSPEPPGRRHVAGGLMFGVGWGVANVCPGPVLAQLGQGIAWALPTVAGVALGVVLYARTGARETEPAAEPAARGGVTAPEPA